MYEEFHSAAHEDKHLKNYLPKRGFFIDVGVGDPVGANNTYHYEMNGWIGLCIEANPNIIDHISLYRKNVLHTAISSRGDSETNFYIRSHQDFSTLISHPLDSKRIQVPCMTLDEVVKKYQIKRIDLLDIDTEYTDEDTWASLTIIRAKIVIIEFNSDEERLEGIMKIHPDYSVLMKNVTNVILESDYD